MSTTTCVGAFAAKTHFSELLHDVENGKRFEIARRGKPVAMLIGVHDRAVTGNGKEALDFFRSFRRTLKVPASEIHDWICEGRSR